MCIRVRVAKRSAHCVYALFGRLQQHAEYNYTSKSISHDLSWGVLEPIPREHVRADRNVTTTTDYYYSQLITALHAS